MAQIVKKNKKSLGSPNNYPLFKRQGFRAMVHLGIMSLMVLSACAQEDENMNGSADAQDIRITPVEVAQAKQADISAYYSNTVSLYPKEEASVVAKVRGIITDIRVEEGDFVKEGQVLAVIEDASYRIELARTKAELDRLGNELKRSKELFDRQLVAAETYEEILYRYEVQKANHELAQLNVEYTQIKAPISGTVSERFIKKGNMINVDSPAFQLVQLQELEAMLYVPEHELYKIRADQTVRLEVDALPGQQFEGKVARISPSIDSNTGTFRVTLSINPKASSSVEGAEIASTRLKPGMFGRVNIKYDTKVNAVMIPKVALVSEDRSQMVYVAVDTMVFKRAVNMGYEEDGWVEITQGLDPSETVVTVGQTTLTDSARIQIISSN